MSDLSVADIETLIKQVGNNWAVDTWFNFNEYRQPIGDLGYAYLIEKNRPNNDDYNDSTRYVIFRFMDRYFKKEGFFSSWDDGYESTRWDGEFYEVEQYIPPTAPAYRRKA